jgi:hypothetical protein
MNREKEIAVSFAQWLEKYYWKKYDNLDRWINEMYGKAYKGQPPLTTEELWDKFTQSEEYQSLPKEDTMKTKEELADELCEYCPLDKKEVYSVPGGYKAGCEGSHCDIAYENYLKSLPKEGRNEQEPCGDCENYAEYCGGIKYCSVCGTKLS